MPFLGLGVEPQPSGTAAFLGTVGQGLGQIGQQIQQGAGQQANLALAIRQQQMNQNLQTIQTLGLITQMPPEYRSPFIKQLEGRVDPTVLDTVKKMTSDDAAFIFNHPDIQSYIKNPAELAKAPLSIQHLIGPMLQLHQWNMRIEAMEEAGKEGAPSFASPSTWSGGASAAPPTPPLAAPPPLTTQPTVPQPTAAPATQGRFVPLQGPMGAAQGQMPSAGPGLQPPPAVAPGPAAPGPQAGAPQPQTPAPPLHPELSRANAMETYANQRILAAQRYAAGGWTDMATAAEKEATYWRQQAQEIRARVPNFPEPVRTPYGVYAPTSQGQNVTYRYEPFAEPERAASDLLIAHGLPSTEQNRLTARQVIAESVPSIQLSRQRLALEQHRLNNADSMLQLAKGKATEAQVKQFVEPLGDQINVLNNLARMDQMLDNLDAKGLLPGENATRLGVKGTDLYRKWLHPSDRDLIAFQQLYGPIMIGQVDRNTYGDKGVRAVAVFRNQLSTTDSIPSKVALQDTFKLIREGIQERIAYNAAMAKKNAGLTPEVQAMLNAAASMATGIRPGAEGAFTSGE